MGYAILRTQKLKSMSSVRRSLDHAFREKDTPNADPEKTPENTHINADSMLEAKQNIEERLPDKVRKNGVLAIEYLITASPEAMNNKTREQQDKYFDDALGWLKERHQKENICYAGIHRDEKTPHMYAYVVPIDDKGKLNCRSFLGGSKALSAMQTDFAERVGKIHGLERGIEGSKAKHQRIKAHYAAIGKETPQLARITAEDLKPKRLVPENRLERIVGTRKENAQELSERLNHKIHSTVAVIQEKARSEAQIRQKAAELERTNKHLNERLEPFRGLSSSEQLMLRELAIKKQREKAVARELERLRKREQSKGIGR